MNQYPRVTYLRGRRIILHSPLLKKAKQAPNGSRGRNPASGRASHTENKPRFKFREHVFSGWQVNYTAPPGSQYSETKRYGYEMDYLVVSRGNKRLKNGAWSGGGDFMVYKVSQLGDLSGPYHEVYNPSQPPWGFHAGEMVIKRQPVLQLGLTHPPNYPLPTVPSFETEAAALVNQYEATGRARTDPGKPLTNNLQAIVELYRDGFKMIGAGFVAWAQAGPKTWSLKSFGKMAGGEWLNLNFGLLPTLKDFKQGVAAIFELDSKLEKLRKESGKSIRRKTTLKDETTITNNSASWNYPLAEYEYGHPVNNTGYTIRSITTITREKVWYVARYKYFMRESTPLNDTVTRALLSGLVPTPSLAWQLLPWSWLLDYFGNIGDVLKNMSSGAADNLVVLHSYLMKETETRVITTYSGVCHPAGNEAPFTDYGGTDFTFHNSWETRTILKVRVGGRNPYGFHLGFADLSSYQQSILAALGISRSSFAKKP